MSNFNFLSPDSRSWSFDERANGYARGEGVAVIVLKRLSDALRDGDTIRAVIQNTAINQDGRTPGITQPSQEAQVDLIRTAYQQVGADMKSTRYFEAHGTGTLVGDPIEARAIGKAFASSRTEDDPLYVGAVKANIGHLEGCSGLASVIKTILVLERGIIPPIAGFETLNHNIDSHELRLHVSTATSATSDSGPNLSVSKRKVAMAQRRSASSLCKYQLNHRRKRSTANIPGELFWFWRNKCSRFTG